METRAFFDPETYTITYIVYDPSSRDAVVIDPVLDLDKITWSTTTAGSIEAVTSFVAERSLRVRWVLDTHAHADHLTGMDLLKRSFGAPTAIGANITAVQELFRGVYNMTDLPADGSQWDELLTDGQELDAGSFKIKTIATPGHTPACLTFGIGGALYTGDALFMPDYGTGRCDFPAGSASDLYNSVKHRIYTHPDATPVFVGHDYQPGGRAAQWETSVGASKERNIQLRAHTSREDFIRFRTERDATLEPPALILQSLQVNIAAGKLPAAEANGKRYLKMPLNFLGG
jgi:glyoxylase-like metal-dependent hydrolase (beta-lactamase superfamily II)